MAEVEWGPAIVFLAGGLAIGALVLWRLTARVARPGPPPAAAETLARRDLQARLDALIAQLRELEDTAGKRTAAQPESERLERELAAAEALVALEALPAPVDSAPARAAATAAATATASPAPIPAAQPRGSSLGGFFWGIGSAAALGLLFYFVSQSARERAPGGTVSGNTPMDGRDAAPSAASGAPGARMTADAAGEDAELAALSDRVLRNPEDLEARLDLARLHLVRQDLMAVFNETQEVLQRDSENPRALSYQALVRLAMGQAERAEAMLLRALARDPELLDGYIHLMLVYTGTGRLSEAEAVFERATQRFPERADSLRRLLAEMRADGEAGPATAPGGEDPHVGVAAATIPSAPVASSAVGGRSISGVIELAPTVTSTVAPGAVVFVTLRVPGVSVGPPLAARRLAAESFPLAFEIGQADSMTGGQIPDQVMVEFRLDADGDLATRPRSDPYGRLESVALGARNLRVALAPRTAE